LVELGYGLLQRWTGGLEWVPFEVLGVGALTFVFVALAVHRRTRDLLTTGVTMAGFTWLAMAFQVPRPVLFSGLFLALLVGLVDRDMRWPIPLLMWVWAGVHGSWALGIGYLVLEGLVHRRVLKTRAQTLAASLIAVTLTAHGVGVWAILLSFARNRKALDFIQEWALPNLLTVALFPFAALIVLLLMAAARGSMRCRDLWIVAPFLLLGLTAGRNIYPAAIILTPWAAAGLPPLSREERRSPSQREAGLNLALAVLLVLAPLVLVFSWPSSLDRERFPVEAARYLGPGRAWHGDGVGGFLIYSAWPQRLVFVDDRAELYGAGFIGDFAATRRGEPVWEESMDRFQIRQALVPSDSGLARVLSMAGWTLTYEGDEWLIYQKD